MDAGIVFFDDVNIKLSFHRQLSINTLKVIIYDKSNK